MINERGRHIRRPIVAVSGAFLQRTINLDQSETMSSVLTTFGIAVGGTSLIASCLALMTRSGRPRNGQKSSPDGGGSDGLTYASGDSGSHFWSWFGSDSV